MSLACDLSPRFFGAMLTGLGKRVRGDESVTYEYLRANLYPETDRTAESIDAQLANFEGVLQRAARGNWTPAQLEQQLAASELGAELAEAFVAFWRAERPRMHETLSRAAVYNGGLSRLAWRVDVKSTSRDNVEMSDPTAIFELTSKPGRLGEGADASTVRFEMNREQLGDLLAQVERIQARINSVS